MTLPENMGVCPHSIVEEVKTFGGDTIAYRCTSCTTILAHHGKCDGCAVERRLSFHVGARKRRFCTEDCYRESERVKREAEKARTAPAAKRSS